LRSANRARGEILSPADRRVHLANDPVKFVIARQAQMILSLLKRDNLSSIYF
jgi:hypothetical protein